MVPREYEQVPGQSIDWLAAVLDSVSQCVAVLDQQGKLVAANSSWVGFTQDNGAAGARQRIGANFLSACRDRSWCWLQTTREDCEAISDVLSGHLRSTEALSRCRKAADETSEVLFLRLRVSGFDHLGKRWAVVEHSGYADSERPFRETFEHAALGLAHVARDGTFLRYNSKLCHILGLSTRELLQCNLRDIIHVEHRDSVAAQLQPLFNGECSETALETRCLGANGDTLWLRLAVSVVVDVVGAPEYLILIADDITAHKSRASRLTENSRQAPELISEITLAEQRERKTLATELHDRLGQPLTFMSMNLTAAKKQCRGRRVGATLDKVLETLRDVNRDIRSMMKSLRSPPEASNLTTVASQTLQEFELRHGLRGNLIEEGLPPTLPPQVESVLARSVRELLTNVVKHAEARGVTVRIRCRADFLELSVEDEGIGPQRGAADGTELNGGFGLQSIREAMQELGGTFVIEARPGGGTKATLSVPLDRA